MTEPSVDIQIRNGGGPVFYQEMMI